MKLLMFLNLIKLTKNQQYKISKLENYSITQDLWNNSQKYIYYIDIQEYKIGEENIMQIYNEYNAIINNIKVTEINESIIYDKVYNNSMDIEKIKKENHIKSSSSLNYHYFEILIKKRKKNQKNFVVLIEPPEDIKNNTKIQIYVLSKIENINIYKNDIDNGQIFFKEFEMDNRKEKYIKFNFINIPLEYNNLILFTNEIKVTTFYLNNISSIPYKTRLFVLEKKSINKSNHTIYLSLLGEMNKTKIQISLDDHDIKSYYGDNRKDISLYIERLNCTKDFYIFESYERTENYHLLITPFYGDYKMVYYNKFLGSKIPDIFRPNNEKEITNKIKKMTNYFNIIKLSCKAPTLLKFKYTKENYLNHIYEGREIITYINYFDICDNTFIYTDSFYKNYRFYFGLYGQNEIYNFTEVSFFENNRYRIQLSNKENRRSSYDVTIFHDRTLTQNVFGCDGGDDGAYLKIYLISNLFYQNVIEGITQLNKESGAIAFKLRKDIIFDYFIFKAYSDNKTYLLSCDYELKIVEKKDIINGNVMAAINEIKIENKNEIYIRFSNPYDKYNSRINQEDFIYLLVKFENIKNNNNTIYVDIRYYYNNSIITLEHSKPKIILNGNEYKIIGDKNNNDKNKLLLNLYKCNDFDYYLRTYYENNENTIYEEKIFNNKNILLHDNLFNNTKFIIYSNNSQNISIKNNSKLASYYENGDIYMNYFPLNESLYNSIKFKNDYNIFYKDQHYNKILFNWNDFIENKEIINNLQINYSLYILPNYSPIKTICQMSLIPPNASLINKNKYEIDLPKGDYKIGIIASIVNEEFPLISLYNFSNINVSIRIDVILKIIISILSVLLFVGIVICCYCRKKRKEKDLIEEMKFARKSRMLSMANFFGYNDNENEHEIILNDDSENK